MNKQTIVSNNASELFIDTSQEYKNSIKMNGDCADNGAMKLLEYCRKFGYENFDLVFLRMNTDDYIKYGRMEFTDDDIDHIRKTYKYWSHILVYNKKLKKYIDQSQGRIIYTNREQYIIERLCPSTEIYHMCAEDILKIYKLGCHELDKLTKSIAHTFVCCGYRQSHKLAIKNWNHLKREGCIRGIIKHK